jgi:hypothetical protein
MCVNSENTVLYLHVFAQVPVGRDTVWYLPRYPAAVPFSPAKQGIEWYLAEQVGLGPFRIFL